MNILVLCTGNKNRSAAGHYLLEKKLEGTLHKVDSAGTSFKNSDPKYPMGTKTRRAMEKFGMKFGTKADPTNGIREHRSKHASKELVQWADKILYMVEGHKKSMLEQYPDCGPKLVSVASFSGGKYDHIEDPAWVKGDEIAVTVCNQIDECLDSMIKEWNLK